MAYLKVSETAEKWNMSRRRVQDLCRLGLIPGALLRRRHTAPAGSPIAFAGWGRKDYPEICGQMSRLCDFSFGEISELEAFLFEA